MKKPVKVKILGKGDWITITKGKAIWNSDMSQFIGKTVKVYKKEGQDVIFKNIKGKRGTNDSNQYYWRQSAGHYRAATLSEISKVIHAVPITPTFKVGDWVVIINSGKNWVSEMNKRTGKVVQLTNVVGNDCIGFADDGSWTWSYSDGHFRKATKAEILKATAALTTPELLGYKAPIDYYGGLVKKDSIALVSSKLGTTYAIRSYRLPQEIVETWVKVYKDPAPAFKVGDYIVAKEKVSYLSKGKIAKIFRIDGESVRYSHAAEEEDFAPMKELQRNCRLATKTEIAESLKVVIGGYEAETTRSSVSFRGEKYGKSELESLIKLAAEKLFEKHPNQIKSLNVGCSGQYKVELSTLKKLQAKLK